MRCRSCEHTQDRGRFCGACGALLDDALIPPERSEANDPTGGHAGGPARWPWRGARHATMLSIAAALVLTVVLRSDPGPDTTSAVTGRVDLGISFDDRATPPITRRPGTRSPWPVAFRHETRTWLLLDDFRRGVIAVDLDTGEERTLGIGEQGGRGPYGLRRLDDRYVVAGWGEIDLARIGPGGVSSQRTFDATVFVPAAEPDQLWLLTYASGRARHAGDLRATLVGPDGQALAEINVLASAPAAESDGGGVETWLEPLRGVPDGLAFRAEDGELVAVDLDGAVSRSFLGEDAVHLLDVSAHEVLWCHRPCDTLLVTEGPLDRDWAGTFPVPTDEDVTRFEPEATWLSPSGQWIATVTWVRLDGGAIDRELHLYDARGGTLLTRAQLPLGDVRGSWSAQGPRFHFTLAPPAGSAGPQLVGGWRFGTDVETFDVAPRLDEIGDITSVASPRLNGRGG